MKFFFKSFYPNLEEQLSIPSFVESREDVWQQLYNWNVSLDYGYFLIHTAGKALKGPSFDLAIAIPEYQTYKKQFFITVQQFLSWETVKNWWLEQKEHSHTTEVEYCPIAILDSGENLFIGLNKDNVSMGAIFYESSHLGLVKLADNLLGFLKNTIKRTAWTKAALTNLVAKNAIEQGQIQLSNFEKYAATTYYPEIVLLQQYQGELQYLITRSSIVLFGTSTREYWLEELQDIQVDKVAYIQLAINKTQQLQVTLDFGHAQEEIILYNIQEQRAIQKLLAFVISSSK